MLWIGGDDKHFSREADVIVNGLHGREFIFEKGNMSGRALFINGGTHIYYLGELRMKTTSWRDIMTT